MTFRKLFIQIIICATASSAFAQKELRPKFDPAKFDAELEQFITTDAALTPHEASVFFPLYREMQKKQRVFFDELRRFRHMDINDDKACREAIERKDKIEQEIKEIHEQYHQKFMKVLPAGKVFQILQSEERFHRHAFKRVNKRQEE